jgi:hypothetical protein
MKTINGANKARPRSAFRTLDFYEVKPIDCRKPFVQEGQNVIKYVRLKQDRRKGTRIFGV